MERMTERLESVKSGAIAASATVVSFEVFSIINSQLGTGDRFGSPFGADPFHWVVSTAIVAVSGFLFGVTYRYIIRDDANPHLKSGGVLAFGLVRGLTQLDLGLYLERPLWPVGVLVLESLVLFAVAGLVLDWAIARHWLKPF
ncbi:hypothetical protein JJD41_12825 [Oxynema sp. CENA135]|nr:hypothetical protein [Oxynema sp. CENA135]